MAGVPSSKGCKTCTKQKKKCDQLKPACTRCARLKIPCIGAGEQKYRFKPVTFQESSCQNLAVVQRPKKMKYTVKIKISPTPRSDSASLANRLIEGLEMSDFRYSLGSYGDFLEHIPKRLGKSDALDTSVKALVSTHPYHYTGQLPPDALVNYISALKALRLCLSCKDKKLAPETLSAIYIIMICQGWIGQSDDHVKSHGEILAHLASSAIVQNWKDTFELRLLETLFVPLVLEAMVNPSIVMDSWFLLIEACLPHRSFDKRYGIRVSSLEAQKLVRMPVFFHTPMLYIAEIKSTYRDMLADQPRVRQYLDDLEQETSVTVRLGDPFHANKTKLYHKFQGIYAVLLTVVIALNSLLRALHPSNGTLLKETGMLVKEFIRLAQRASQFRPLGASFIEPCLAAVWATTDALPAQQAELQRLMTEYQPDFPQISWMEQAVWLNSSHKCLLTQVSGSGGGEARWEGQEMLNISMVHCKGAFGLTGSHAFL
ncbi:Fc.00g033350.m01.CDS01 [Cosmosporella sp. VM-42]